MSKIAKITIAILCKMGVTIAILFRCAFVTV
jgi:hypothetical protein